MHMKINEILHKWKSLIEILLKYLTINVNSTLKDSQKDKAPIKNGNVCIACK